MPGERRKGRFSQRSEAAVEHLTIDGNAEAVANGLQRLFSLPVLANLNDDSRGSVEIVLAEVLNNISEHAYSKHSGAINLWITPHDTFLFVRVVDTGLPMPGGEAPAGALSKVVEIQDLPEGGFGWFLIRSLTQELTYQRDGNHNTLSFCVDVDYRH
jgi:serine/threonine-protein kinase RsbW